MEKNKLKEAFYILDIIERLADLHFETANCPEYYSVWSNFGEEYDKFMYSMIATLRGVLQNDKK